MRTAAPRSVAVRSTRIVAWRAPSRIAPASPLTLPIDPPELAVEEDPVVELAAPDRHVGVADEPVDDREGLPERRAVDRDPAVPRPRALDDVDAVELGGRARARRQGRPSACVSIVAARRPPRGPPAASRRTARGSRRRRRSAPRRGARARSTSPRRRASGSRRRIGRRRGRCCRSSGRRGRPSGAARSGRSRRPSSGASHGGGSRSVSVGPNRDDVVGRSRSASSLAIATAVKTAPAPVARTRRDDDPADEAPAPHRRLAEQPAGDAEARRTGSSRASASAHG